MKYLPEFIELLREIRDRYYHQMQAWHADSIVLLQEFKDFKTKLGKINVGSVITVPVLQDGSVGVATATFDPTTMQFSLGLPAGADGLKGDTGPQGIQGHQGVDGPTGTQGHRGVQGMQGIHGTHGDPGKTGPVGSQGHIGIDGIQGPIGKPGIHGDPGQTGSAGHEGKIGPAGVQGHRGEIGLGIRLENVYNTLADLKAANTNPEVGDTHLVKFQVDGITPKGDLYVFDNPVPPHDISGAGWHNVGHIQGPEGKQGPEGPRGPNGIGIVVKGTDTKANITAKDGHSGDLWIDSSNGHAFVSDGTKGKTQWTDVGAFRGQRGLSGHAGGIGPQGPHGPRGASVTLYGTATEATIKKKAGKVGDMWIDSATGHVWVSHGGGGAAQWKDAGAFRGPKGLAGGTGHAGPQGNAGPKGPAGAKGHQGIQGHQGVKGDKGATGPIGPKGDIGPQGQNGPQGRKGDTGPSIPLANLIETGAGVIDRKAVTPAGVKKFYLPLKGGALTGNLKVKSTDTSGGMYVFSPLEPTKYVFKLGYKANGEGALYSNKTGQLITYKLNGDIDIEPKAGKKLLYNGVEVLTAAGGTITGPITSLDIDPLRVDKTSWLKPGYIGISGGEFAIGKSGLGKMQLKEDGSIDITPKSGKKLYYRGVEVASVDRFSTSRRKLTGASSALFIHSFQAGGVDLTHHLVILHITVMRIDDMAQVVIYIEADNMNYSLPNDDFFTIDILSSAILDGLKATDCDGLAAVTFSTASGDDSPYQSLNVGTKGSNSAPAGGDVMVRIKTNELSLKDGQSPLVAKKMVLKATFMLSGIAV